MDRVRDVQTATHVCVPPNTPQMHLVTIIIQIVLLTPKTAIDTAIPILPYKITGFLPKLSEAYVQGITWIQLWEYISCREVVSTHLTERQIQQREIL